MQRSNSNIELLKKQLQEAKSAHTAEIGTLKETSRTLETENGQLKAKIDVYENERTKKWRANIGKTTTAGGNEVEDVLDLKMQLRVSETTLRRLQMEMVESKMRLEELSSKEAQFDTVESLSLIHISEPTRRS